MKRVVFEIGNCFDGRRDKTVTGDDVTALLA
jgi:hypothetical protein